MKKSLLFLPLVASLPLAAMAQDWNDVTEQMLQNPCFEENTKDGWDCIGYPINCSDEAIEAFNCWFDISQTIVAPAGRYRLSCQAYYRMGSHSDAYIAHWNDEEDIAAVLYAGDNSVLVPSLFDYCSEGEPQWWEQGWVTYDGNKYPDRMSTGSIMFKDGNYPVSLEFTHEGGELQLGVKSRYDYHLYNSDWCMMSNFTLEYDGFMDVIPVEYFYCYDEELNMMPGDTYTLVTYVYPTSATERDNIEWKSSNTRVAKVDSNGQVTAVGAGTATITGICDGHEVTVTVKVTKLDETGKAWVDVTDEYLQNVNMEDGFDAWNRTPARVDYQMAEFWNVGFDFYQEVDLPEGYYRFSCEGFFRPTDSPQAAFNQQGTGDNKAYIYGGTRFVPMLDITSETFTENLGGLLYQVYDYNTWDIYYLPNSMEAAKYCFENGYYHYSNVVFYTDGGIVPVGLRCDNWISGQWAIFDNFRLEKLTELVATQNIAVSAEKNTLVPGETMQIDVTITPSNATFQTVLWESNDPEVLTVDKNGLVTAKNEGTAIIIATARDNEDLQATFTITVRNHDIATDALIVNEVMTMNVDQILDPSFNYGGWIELYNTTDQAISLKGCYVTEHPDDLTEHRLEEAGVVPAKGYYTIWFDHYDCYYRSQVSFKLSTSGDWVALVSPSGEIIAQIDYPAGIQRCSWARKVDGGAEWGYTAQPTPGATNATSTWATKQLAAPTVDVQAHIFDSPVTVQATWPKGSTLRYTMDGTTPTADNGETSEDGIFEITETTNLRLCAIQDGMLPSAVTTNTYIKREYDFTIPVLSITADYEDIWGDDHGIFVRGSGNGRTGNGQSSKCNWNQDWDHPCAFEYYNTDGVRTFMQDVDICAAGGWSRAWEPHSFKLKAAKKYGLNSMDYPFFESKPFNKHKALQIRNGGNDNNCRFKDAAIQTIIQRSGIYVDGQAYQPVIQYINGEFLGVINMREPNNKHHAYSNYGYDTDFMDQFEMSPDSGWICKTGNREAYDRLIALSEQCAAPEVYETICNELLDIDEYINYMACCLWLGGSDWMRNNVKAYRSTETDGKFHYVLFDTDGSFGSSGRGCFTRLDSWNHTLVAQDPIYELGGKRLQVPFENVDIWFNLLQNDSFRKQFVDTYCLVSGSVFEATRCREILDELYNRVQPMMQLNGGSAWSTYNSLRNNDFTTNRVNTNIDGIAQYWAFANETQQNRKITFSSNIPEATILYNDIDVPTGKFTGKAYLPVTLKACAPGGYDFVGWMLKGGSVTPSASTVFAQQSEWAYYDQGSLDGVNWTSASYNASEWAYGQAPLGYDDGSSAQGVGGLLNTSGLHKGTTFYFRKEFTLNKAPNEDDVYELAYVLDDGCVVYVNGQEAARNNMPNGEVSYNTVATTYAHDNPNRGTLLLPANLFKKGRNVIAIEVHNNSATSSDICWDGALSVTKNGEVAGGEIISEEAELNIESLSNGAEVIAVYATHEPTGDELAVAPVRINEVSASNDTYANEYFKRNDWIELYNTTDEDYDIAGMYITDNINKPQKYQVPTQLESGVPTVIPAHGYMIVWCDKLAPLSQQHASFKLAAEEAAVMLTAADGSWYDYLNYPAHDRNYTAGRYPDGSDNVYLMTKHTPAATNQLSSYVTPYEIVLPEELLTGVSSVQESSDLTITFDGQNLMTSCMARIEVYTVSGELIMTVPSANAINLDTLRPGIYVARAKANGATAVVKFRK